MHTIWIYFRENERAVVMQFYQAVLYTFQRRRAAAVHPCLAENLCLIFGLFYWNLPIFQTAFSLQNSLVQSINLSNNSHVFLIPLLVSCGVESMTCHPPYPAGRSVLVIHTSFHAWKFLNKKTYGKDNRNVDFGLDNSKLLPVLWHGPETAILFDMTLCKCEVGYFECPSPIYAGLCLLNP